MDKGTSKRGRDKRLQKLFTLLILFLPLYSYERIYVKEVHFEGNNRISDKKLKEVIGFKENSKIRRGEILLGIQKLEDFYHSQGFLEAKITGYRFLHRQDKYFIYYYIHEGNQKIIKNIEIQGKEKEILNRISFPKLPLTWKDETVYRFENDLYLTYKKMGFPFFEFEREIIELLGDSISIFYNLKEGKRAKINNISISGLKRVRKEIALREIEIKKGEFFNIERLENSISNLYSTGLFTKIEYEILPRNDSSFIDVSFKMDERKERVLNIGTGYTSEGDIGLRSSFSHLNIFNNGGKFIFEVNLLQNLKFTRHFEINTSYIEPFPFGFRFPLSLTIFYYKDKDEKILRRGGEAGVLKNITRYLQINSKLNMQKVEGKEEGKIYLNSFTISFIFDDRINFMDPDRGLFSLIHFLQAGNFLGGEADLRKILIDFSFFVPFHFSLLALRFRTGSAFPYGRTETIPLSEKFLLGGEGSVRGVPRFGIGEIDERGIRSGDYFINSNFEIRFKYLKWNFYPVLFFDSGILKNKLIDLKFKNFTNTGGIGIRTKIFNIILRADIGYNLKKFNFKRGFLYLGIGHMF
ncbi:MAG: POTRA domain-containing protein [candidate division WOR-3 bacterium]